MAAQTRETGEGFLAEVSVEILKAGKLASHSKASCFRKVPGEAGTGNVPELWLSPV